MTTAKKIQRLLHQQSALATKVYEAVPVQEPAARHIIFDEVSRLGTTANSRAISGCLSCLKDDGLIKEPTPNHYIRVVPKAGRPRSDLKKPHRPVLTLASTEISTEEAHPMSDQQSDNDTQPLTAIDKLTGLADVLHNLADEIETIALELSEQETTVQQSKEGLRQLKKMLDNIT